MQHDYDERNQIMRHMYRNCCELGIQWILAFVIIASITVTTCIRQQEQILASTSQTVIAMK